MLTRAHEKEFGAIDGELDASNNNKSFKLIDLKSFYKTLNMKFGQSQARKPEPERPT